VSDAVIARACSTRARRERFRRLAQQQHVRRDGRQVTKQKLEDLCPGLLEMLRAAVAANTDVSYKASDAPVDAMVV